MIWVDIRLLSFFGLAFLLLLTMTPVAITGGVFLTKYIYCDVAKLCEVKK